MRKHIYIHIGAHKTGTTAVQSVLSANRRLLADRGVLYPTSCTYAHGQHRLAFALKGGRDPSRLDRPVLETELSDLLSEIAASEQPNILVSSEEFFATDPEQLSRMRDALADHVVHIIAVIRRPDELFASIYNQRTKSISSRATIHYARYLGEPSRLHRDLDFSQCLGDWAKVFGQHALQVLTYESERDAVALICKHIGMPSDGLDRSRLSANESRNVKTLDLIRIAKLEGIPATAIAEMVGVADAYFNQTAPRASLLSPEERMTILRAMDPITNVTFERYVGRANEYHSGRFDVADFPAQTPLSSRDMIKLLANVVENRQGAAGS